MRFFNSPPPPLEPGEQPETFRIAGWKVFRPGYHKGRLFARLDCKHTVDNFQILSTGENPHLRPKAKFGHDTEERIKKSLGVPNVGTVSDCRFDPADGGFFIDIDNIPSRLMVPDAITGEPVSFDLKAEFDRGGFNDGSVELEYGLPDPNDPAKKLPGPVLVGVAYLGEEQPAVKGLPAPVATFSAHSSGQLPESEYARRISNTRARRTRVVFSEVEPMPTRDEILAKLKELNIDVGDATIAGKTDDELFNMLKVLGDDGLKSAMAKKFAAESKPDPVPTPTPTIASDKPEDKEGFATKFSAFMDDCTKRMGAMEQAVGDMQKLKPDLQAAAKFSQDYTAIVANQKRDTITLAVDAAVREGKLLPADREDKIAAGMTKDNATKFSAGADAGKTPLEVWLAELAGRAPSFMFSETIDDSGKDAEGNAVLSPAARKMLENTPEGRLALAQAAKATA
jgi:hypothetical protein